MIRQV